MELLPPAKRGGDQKSDGIKSTAVDLIPLTPDQVYQLRKVYGGLPADQLAELKAKAVETVQQVLERDVRKHLMSPAGGPVARDRALVLLTRPRSWRRLLPWARS